MNSLPTFSTAQVGMSAFGASVALNSLATSPVRSKTPRSAIRAWSLLTLTQNESRGILGGFAIYRGAKRRSCSQAEVYWYRKTDSRQLPFQRCDMDHNSLT